MDKHGNFISLARVDDTAWGTIFRGFRAEDPKIRERALFYQVPLAFKLPESFPHHIAVLDVLSHEMVQGKLYFGHRYVAGFPLSMVLKRCARDGFPLPLDHALLIMERVLAAFEEYRPGFPHPFLIWMTFEGEVKCSPLPLSRAFPKWKNDELLAYLSPQLTGGEEWSRADQVYAAGALFFELLTGKSLPRDASENLRIDAVLKTPVMAEGPIPKDLQMILLKALAAKVPERCQHVKNMREELGHLIYSGAYTPTTFNLAFFMHSLFRDEVDGEEKTLEQEDAVDLAPLFRKPEPPKPAEPARPAAPPPSFAASGAETEKRKNPVVFLAVAAVAILAIVAGIFFLRGKGEEPAPAAAQTSPADLQKQKELEDKLLASQKALEDLQQSAQQQKEEMEKLQKAQKEGEKNPEIQKAILQKQREAQDLESKLKAAEQAKKDIQEQKAKTLPSPAPAAVPAGTTSPGAGTPPGSVPAAGAPAGPAAGTPGAVPAPGTTVAAVPGTEPPAPPSADAPPPAAAAPGVKEGELISLSEVDAAPVPMKKVQPVFPPIAKLKKLRGKITLKVLVSEKGKPLEVQVVSVTTSPPNVTNVGFEKAAEEAVRQWEFQPATKGGIRVKTWFLVPVVFE